MRITSGQLRGRLFDAPKGHRTRPMADRVISALFNTIGDISGKNVLDPYGGSGAIGFEAISRGASSSQIVEIDNAAFQVIKKNITELGLGESVKVTKANITSWLATNPDANFDLIICDPPYDKLSINALNKLASHLADGGTFVLSHSGSKDSPEIEGLTLEDSRKYGDANLAYYSK